MPTKSDAQILRRRALAKGSFLSLRSEREKSYNPRQILCYTMRFNVLDTPAKFTKLLFFSPPTIGAPPSDE